MKTYYNSGNYGNEISLTLQDVKKCSNIGDCYEDIKKVIKKPYIKKQIKLWERETLKAELYEYGAWDDSELENHEENTIRWVWLSAGSISDNM